VRSLSKSRKMLGAITAITAVIAGLLLIPASPAGRYEDDGSVGAVGHIDWDFSRGKLYLVIEEEAYSKLIGDYCRTNGAWELNGHRFSCFWWGVKIDNRVYWRCLQFWKHKTQPTKPAAGKAGIARPLNRTSLLRPACAGTFDIKNHALTAILADMRIHAAVIWMQQGTWRSSLVLSEQLRPEQWGWHSTEYRGFGCF
jgi:hypothetical protein